MDIWLLVDWNKEGEGVLYLNVIVNKWIVMVVVNILNVFLNIIIVLVLNMELMNC